MTAQSQPETVPAPPEINERPAECEKHGAYTARRFLGNRWSSCAACLQEENAARKAREERAARRERQETWLRHSGLMGRFLDATFDNFCATTPEQRTVLAACREFVTNCDWNSGGGLWLIGPPGTGKTHMGSSLVRAAIQERDAEAAIHSAREIVRMLRAKWGQRGGRDYDGQATTEEQLIDDLGHLQLLVIDEAGVGFGSEGEQIQLLDIVDLRYRRRRPTVLLSNLPPKALKGVLGDRSYDRLREGAKLLTCQWPSHRGQPLGASL